MAGGFGMKRFACALALLAVFASSQSPAQMAGHNGKGDVGLMAGTQAPPGFYVMPSYFNYYADTVRDGDGDKVPPILGGGGSIDSDAALLGLLWVSDTKIFGGNYSASIWPSITNSAVEFPAFPALDSNVSSGFGDLYIQPISLGWNKERADFIAGVGIYAPTGQYELGGENNRGLGMWSYELFGATTLYLNSAKTWHLAAFAAYETHGKKKGTDARVGDLITLEGGLGMSFMEGAASAGIAYYAQWKITDDDFGLDFTPPGGPLLERHRVYGLGPEVTFPIASRKKLYGFINLRYIWEMGAVQSMEGNSFMLTLSFPVPSIPLQ